MVFSLRVSHSVVPTAVLAIRDSGIGIRVLSAVPSAPLCYFGACFGRRRAADELRTRLAEGGFLQHFKMLKKIQSAALLNAFSFQ